MFVRHWKDRGKSRLPSTPYIYRPDQTGSSRSSQEWPGTRPEQSGFRQEQPGIRPERPGSMPEESGNKPRRSDYSPRAWERWFHAAYFGEVFYWKRGLTVIPYHFDPYLVHVPNMEWRDDRGKFKTAKAYNRRSRRFRRAVDGAPLHLVRDFAPLSRGSFQSKNLEVPMAMLFGRRKRKL